MSLLVSGCKTFEQYVDEVPITEFRVPHITESIVIDGKVYYAGACSVRKITDKKDLGSVRDHIGGLGECNGSFGIPPVEFSETRVWLRKQY